MAAACQSFYSILYALFLSIEINLLQILRVLNRVLEETPLLKAKIFAMLILGKDKFGSHIFY